MGLLQVCLAAVLWGTAPVALAAAGDTPVVVASAGRLLIGSAVLWCLSSVLGTAPGALRLLRRGPLTVFAIGAGVASYQTLWFLAIQEVGAAVVTVLALGLGPVLLTVWEATKERRRPTGGRMTAVVVGLAGLLTVASSQTTSDVTDAALGVGLASLSGAAFAATTVLSRRAAVRSGALPLTATTTAVAGLVLVPFAVVHEPVLVMTTAAWTSVAHTGLVTVSVAFLLLDDGLRTTSASTASVAVLLEPATASVLAVALLGEVLGWSAWSGVALTLSAVAVLAIADRSPEDRALPTRPG